MITRSARLSKGPKNTVTKKTKSEVFKTVDMVLPILDLGRKCKIAITITENEIFLNVGQRDISWDRKTREVTGSGTLLI